jgi:hypothetical protein
MSNVVPIRKPAPPISAAGAAAVAAGLQNFIAQFASAVGCDELGVEDAIRMAICQRQIARDTPAKGKS